MVNGCDDGRPAGSVLCRVINMASSGILPEDSTNPGVLLLRAKAKKERKI